MFVPIGVLFYWRHKYLSHHQGINHNWTNDFVHFVKNQLRVIGKLELEVLSYFLLTKWLLGKSWGYWASGKKVWTCTRAFGLKTLHDVGRANVSELKKDPKQMTIMGWNKFINFFLWSKIKRYWKIWKNQGSNFG